jgi:hypothetical protein
VISFHSKEKKKKLEKKNSISLCIDIKISKKNEDDSKYFSITKRSVEEEKLSSIFKRNSFYFPLIFSVVEQKKETFHLSIDLIRDENPFIREWS